MTAVLDLSKGPLTEMAPTATRVHALLDELAGEDLPDTPVGLAGAIGEWERAVRRIEAHKLRLLARAERRKVAKGAGLTGTDAWLATTTRTARREAAGQVRLATTLDTHDLAATRDALTEGSVSRAHASVIADAVDRLPDWIVPADRHAIEARLVHQAHLVDPPTLRHTARRCLDALPVHEAIVDAHEDDLLRGEENRARSRVELTMWDNADGTTSGRFTVPRVAGAVLRKAIDAMTSPRRSGIAAAKDARALEWDRDARAHRAGQAFTSLVERLPTDRLPHKSAATVIVTIDWRTLTGQLRAAGLDAGDKISAGEARRIACTAGVLPAVLDGASLPLDLGRARRLFSETQRLALATRHTECAAAGCDRPFAWCELHHRRPWQSGGTTDLADALPLCSHHHRRIHDPAYRHRIGPGPTVEFHRRT
ncbi:MAG: DUF222 domain-containing protein [Nocardioides sp.]